MKWMKAGRPATRTVEQTSTEQEQKSIDWRHEELTVYTDGYVALAAAILKQCRKDNVAPSEEPELCKDIIELYAERMISRLGENKIGTVEED